MKKVLAIVLAAIMVLSMASCNDSSSTADSSKKDSETQNLASSSDTDSSSKSETTSTAENDAAPPESVGTDLKEVAQSVLNAKLIDISRDPENLFRAACDKGAGEYSIVPAIKTSKLFDPFDDLYMSSSQQAMESAKPYAQIYVYSNSYDVVEEDQPTTESDGMVYALSFNCKDEDEAKQLYSLVFTEEMKQNALTDEDKPVYDFGTDHAIIKFKDHYGENVAFCYYRAGNNVLAAAEYTVEETVFKELDPKNYTKQADYDGLLDKLCKAFGAEKLPSSLKLQ